MKMRMLVVVIVAVAMLPLANCKADDRHPTSSSVSKPVKLLPWVEDNYAGYDERVIEGLKIWSRVTDTAIVSTMPGRAELYRKLRQRVPGMHIIPGIKTRTLLPVFDSVEGWRRVAEEVAAVSSAAGERVVLLENETAIRPYRRGEQKISLDRLRDALAQLPKGIGIIWYPSIHSPRNPVHDRYENVCRVVAEVCDVRFTDRSTQSPAALHEPWRREVRRTLERLSSKPTLPLLYAYAQRSSTVYWLDQQIPEALAYVRREWGEDAELIIYPGMKRWGEAARSISDIVTRSAETAPAHTEDGP
jgi:hypothetical protein